MRPAISFLLAQISSEVPMTPREGWIVAVAVICVCGIGLAVLATWAACRRNPPIEREIDDRINDKFTELEDRVEKKLDDLKKDFEARKAQDQAQYLMLQTSVQSGFTDLHRALGRIEGAAGIKP